MKKITLISIILVLISMTPIVAQEIIFEDDFESYTVGTFPSDNWFLKYSGSGTGNQVVVDNQYVSPTQSLLLECNPNWAGTADVQLSQTPSIIYCEGYLKSEQEFGGPDFGFQNPDIGPWGTAYASVGVCKSGNITCNNQVLQSSEANKWYHIKIKYDSYLDLCDVWIDGVLKGQDIPCSTNGEYSIIRLSTHNPSSSTKGWYDDIKVYTDTNEPTVTVISPNGGEYWQWDTQHSISWTSTSTVIENVTIWLSHDSGNSYPDLLFENTANDGEEPWTIPEAQCNTARIKIEGYDAEGELVAEDESNKDFFIYVTPPIDLDSGLVAYYPFNGNAEDESENENHGTVYGAILSTDRFGDFDKAYSFDGVDDNISSSPILPIGNLPRSVSVWFNTTSASGSNGWYHNTAISWGDISNNNLCAISIYQTKLKFGVWGGSNDVNTNNIVNDGNWHHVVVSYNNTMLKIYLDNIEVASVNRNLNTINSSFYIGRRAGQSNQNMDGKVDDVRIYDRALNDFEVQALYHEGDWKIKPSFETELSDQAACKNDSVAFEAIAEGIPPINYQWQKGGIDIPGATDSVLIISNVQAEDEGEYRCTATNDHGTGTSNTAILSVEFAIPTIISGFTSVHEYQVATYSADMQEGHTYEFIVEGGNVIDGTENSVTVHWGEPGQGFISLIESSDLGCYADTNVLNVTVGYLGIEDHETNKLSVYPNPFSTSTTIEFELRQTGKVEVKIYNQMGELIEIIQKTTQPGKQTFTWDAIGLPSGIYFIRLQVGNEIITRKIIKHQ